MALSLKTNSELKALYQNCRLGLEIEEHRVTATGHLSQTPYPGHFGSRQSHPYFQSDFGESQSELVTGVFTSTQALMQQLTALQTIWRQALPAGEQIWPFSMPPNLTENEQHHIREHFGRPAYQAYRDYLKTHYALSQSLTTGVHVNFSLPATLDLPVAAHNALYFKIAQSFVSYRWLLTYLFGASPNAAPSHLSALSSALKAPVRSIRNSQFGFTNAVTETIPYTSLAAHVQALDHAVTQGDLYSPHEFYGPVRLKGPAAISDLLTQPIDHLECRVLDLDPFSANGIDQTTVEFLRLLLVFGSQQPAKTAAELAQMQQWNRDVALEHPLSSSQFAAPAEQVLAQLATFAQQIDAPAAAQAVANMQQRARHPALTPSARIITTAANWQALGCQLGQQHQHTALQQTWLEVWQAQQIPPAVQQLLALAYRRGITVVAWQATTGTLTLAYQGQQAHFSATTQGLYPLTSVQGDQPELEQQLQAAFQTLPPLDCTTNPAAD
ncbi:gamma-glutamylcysteine synthetase [Loigolactobacillus bifermentans DSM 20003]|uniref:Glutamate--cysteine ligase n=1 Tax=Loigolactobacillus bifermentans DSM 20003 TaxID=1423726 RepID=A0A0R1GEC4_9LACO|nr:gamma-glutamylcysteine synthetase [Loigolactobacillus bifermentans DSM 20003]